MDDFQQLAMLTARLGRDLGWSKLDKYAPYHWQAAFHEAGREHPERMLMAANRVGKTLSAAAEVAFHLTGDYPSWWRGKRFEAPILAWTGSPTSETSKDIVQKQLLGGLDDKLGTGLIPKSRIAEKPGTRRAVVGGVADTIKVHHASGGLSVCSFKTYEQGWIKWTGTDPEVVWLDEEPDDYMIYSESQTRILTSGGVALVTFTPLRGETELVRHFTGGGPGIHLQSATWDDADHLSESDKERLSASYRIHERDARTKGVPMMGEGAVFPVEEKEIRFNFYGLFPEGLPRHFVQIMGCDFGIDHPGAGAHIGWDRDKDVIYVIDCYRKSGEAAVYHAAWFNRGDTSIPVAWPHDGMNREKSGGKPLADAYRAHGVRMLNKSARYPRSPGDTSEQGGAQPVEPIVDEILERMMTGRFKVADHLSEWFEEFRGFHRKNGRIVANRDDILKATMYGVMMKRYAVAPGSGRPRPPAPMNPIASARY